MAKAPKLGEVESFSSGPFTGVTATVNPFDDTPNQLTDALNGYLPDPAHGSEFAARPGAHQDNLGLTDSQLCVFTCVSAGVAYTFVAIANVLAAKIYRLTPTGTIQGATYTDVTPSGIALSSTAGAGGFHMTQINGQLIVSDSVNRPWVGTALSSTPITGTAIDMDGVGGSWSALGEPQVYIDTVQFIARTVPSGSAVTAGIGIVWSEPNQPAVGYTQSGFENFWNLIQTGTTQLFALKATNNGMYYFRENAIGVLTGQPSVNFQNTATQDVVSYNLGCVASKSIKIFGNYVYFCDAKGRPWRFAIGGVPEPIWLQVRQFYEAAASANVNPVNVQNTVWAQIEPNLNVYIVFTWPANIGVFFFQPNQQTGYVFDANTGTFMGRWQCTDWGSTFGADSMACGGIVTDSAGDNWLMMLGAVQAGSPAPTITHSAWTLYTIADGVWKDGPTGGTPQPVMAQTQRLGYSGSVQWSLERVRAITSNTAPVVVTSVSTNGTQAQPATTPGSSSDGTNLVQWAPSQVQGRGFQLQFVPSTTATQWRVFRAEIDVTGAVVQTSDG